jgi:putative flippase GtrA
MRGLTLCMGEPRTFACQYSRVLVPQLTRYTALAVLALAIDTLVFLSLAGSLLRPSFAGVVGYGAGLVVQYFGSVRFVFDARSSAKTQVRLFVEFAASGLLGMSLTALVIGLATAGLGLPLLFAKGLAVGISFAVVFAVRRLLVFAPRNLQQT